MHLVSGSADLPSLEGILVSRSPEYLLAVPLMLTAAGGNPAEFEANHVAIPKERVAFFEVLS